MAVISVNETSGATLSQDDKYVSKAERRFVAVCSSTTDTPAMVLAAIGISVNDPYIDAAGNIIAGLVCTNRNITQDENPLKFEVRVEYSTIAFDPSKADPVPTNRPPDITWGTVQYSRVLKYDGYGRAIVNSAGEPFDPPIEVDDLRQTLTITRFEPTYDPNLVGNYTNHVNSDTFFGFSPGTVKCQNIGSRSHFENGVFCYQLTYEFHMRSEGWQAKVLDQGFRTYDEATNKYTSIISSDGTISTNPTLLNGQGGELRLSNSFLVDAYTDTDLVMDFDDRSVFPSDVGYYVQADSEIMKVIEHISTDSVQVVRGQLGTSAAAHSGGTIVKQVPVFLDFTIYPTANFSSLGLP